MEHRRVGGRVGFQWVLPAESADGADDDPPSPLDGQMLGRPTDSVAHASSEGTASAPIRAEGLGASAARGVEGAPDPKQFNRLVAGLDDLTAAGCPFQRSSSLEDGIHWFGTRGGSAGLGNRCPRVVSAARAGLAEYRSAQLTRLESLQNQQAFP